MQIAVIGGGITGLAAAYRLARLGHRVVLYEAQASVGGLASGFKEAHWDYSLDRFYHHWFESDHHVLDLAGEMEVRHRVLFTTPVTSVWLKERAFPADSPLRMLRLPAGAIIHRLRSGLVIAYLRFFTNWRSLERQTAERWLSRWMGRAGYEALWKPMLSGKFGRHAHEVNMAWFWARVRKRSRRLGYFQGGFQAFADALAEKINACGGQVLVHSEVSRIHTGLNGRLSVASREGLEDYDRVLSTVPPPVMKDVAPSLPDRYKDEISKLRTLGAITLILSLRKNLTDRHYWINLPKAEGFPFLVLVEHTNFIDPGHYGGDHLVYCGDYLSTSHPNFRLGRSEILEKFIPALQRINPAFDRTWVKDVWLFRTPYAQPIPLVDQSLQIPASKTPVPGLFWAWMGQIYPWDRGTNYAVSLGLDVAMQIHASSRSPHDR